MIRSLLLITAGLVAAAGAPAARAGELDRAIIITNKDYERYKYTHDVRYAHNDGQAMKRAMIDVFKIPEARISVVQDVTLGRLREMFGAQKARDGEIYEDMRHPKGRLFVYYSGHGMPGYTRSEPNTPRAYLMPVDANPQRIASSGYALAELIERLTEIKTDRLFEGEVYLILEACFSGRSSQGAVIDKSSAGPVRVVGPQMTGSSRDIVILSASRDDEIASWDDKAQLGVFTNALLHGLYGLADQDRWKGNADMKLTIGELKRFMDAYVNDRLRRLYKETRRQTPTFQGNIDAELVSYGPVYPIRDQRVLADEETSCRILRSSDDDKRISDYLQNCEFCLCQTELEKRLADLMRGRRSCDSERETADRFWNEGNLRDLMLLESEGRCLTLKPELKGRIEELKSICAREQTRYEDMKKKHQIKEMRIWAEKRAQCRDVISVAMEYSGRIQRACESARKQFDTVKAAKDPDTLRSFARRTDCLELRKEAETLADQIDGACGKEQVLFNQFALRKNFTAIRRMAEAALCPDARDRAKAVIARLEQQCATEAVRWDAIKGGKDIAAMEKLRGEIECDRIKDEIQRRTDEIANADVPPIGDGKPVRECPGCPEVVLVKPGCFMMGAVPGDQHAVANESPQIQIRIAAPFGIGTREVTVGEWAICHAEKGCALEPPAGVDRALPMTNVTPEEVDGFIRWLSQKSRRAYRLPSEAEWEFAARAGTRTPYWTGERITTGQARFKLGTSPSALAPVGTFPANPFGLFDVHGNAAEMVADCYADTHSGASPDGRARTGCREPRRVVRGGSFQMLPMRTRSSWRDFIEAGRRSADVGFRVARTVLPTESQAAAPQVCPR